MPIFFINKISKEEGVIILTYNDVQRKRTLALEQLRNYKPKFLNLSRMFSLHDRNMHLELSQHWIKLMVNKTITSFSSKATL